MRSAADTTVPVGRHRWDRPGAVPVTSMITVARRGFLRGLLTTGRHAAGPVGPPPVLHQLRGAATA